MSAQDRPRPRRARVGRLQAVGKVVRLVIEQRFQFTLNGFGPGRRAQEILRRILGGIHRRRHQIGKRHRITRRADRLQSLLHTSARAPVQEHDDQDQQTNHQHETNDGPFDPLPQLRHSTGHIRVVAAG